ncbi:copia protein [Tanacetum coccineum]
MSASNQQTLTDLGPNDRPLMLEKGNFIPWESRFRRFLDNKLEDGKRMWHSIQKGPYVRTMITDPDDTTQQIIEPLSKMTEINKKQYTVDVRGSEVTSHVRHARLMDEFDKFVAKEGESLESVYERLTTLVNIMERNNIRPVLVSINTKFLNFLKPERSKYVIIVRHNQTGHTVLYAQLYDSLVQFELHIQASKVKRASRNHDPLALISHSNASSRFHARNVNDESIRVVQRVPRTESNTGKANVQCYNYNEKGHYARDCQKSRVCDAKYFKEQMLSAMKDEAESNCNAEENDFMLDNSFGDETFEELIVATVSEVNASYKDHEKVNNVKRKTIIHASDDDQIDSNVIFDDPYVENNGDTSEHDSNDHDEYHNIQILAYNVQREAENQKRLNNELKKQKELLQKELETYIVDLEEKRSSHDRIVYKMGQSIQTIHMLGKTPNKVYDPFIKAGLGYQNPERLKIAIAAQPKMYHGEMLYSTKLKINSSNSEETLEDAEESRLKMRNKMVQLNYEKLNALYETFVP